MNVYVDIDEGLEVLCSNRSVKISNSDITCKWLKILAEQIVFEVHEQQKVSLVSQSPIELVMTNGAIPEIEINGTNLSLSIPNSMQYYKLVKFNHEYTEDCELSLGLFAHCLRRIMVHFRKHRKDAPARDAEKIDYVIIGHGKNRKKVFDFLIDNDVIYREDPLYKINVAKMEAVGINWGAVTCDDTQRLLKVYDTFTRWIQENAIK